MLFHFFYQAKIFAKIQIVEKSKCGRKSKYWRNTEIFKNHSLYFEIPSQNYQKEKIKIIFSNIIYCTLGAIKY